MGTLLARPTQDLRARPGDSLRGNRSGDVVRPMRIRDARTDEVGALTELQRRASLVWEEDRDVVAWPIRR